MIPKRGYQTDFYASFERIHQREARINRANKIKWALQQYLPSDSFRTTCLDIGCSAGIITAQLAPIFEKTLGADYDRTGLAAIHPQDKEKVLFIRSDALYLPFASNSVGVVICAQVYEHVPNDLSLVEEVYRVLRPGGYCFFSGPNWLFPIEPHYFLPFLHWLPETWANRYLQLTKLGVSYYERSRTIWGLRRLLHRFEIKDITLDILLHFYLAKSKGLARVLKLIPLFIWEALLPLLPNFNWILQKPKP